jgi:ADP-ribosylglycohydrolase/fructose-1,6-bisphosphatase/inositol monophosphatase family enzyme
MSLFAAPTAESIVPVTPHPDLPVLCDAVIAAAEAAGRRIAAEFAQPQGPRGRGSHADVDDEIEAELRERLLGLMPARWCGEESGVAAGPGGAYCWLVDPHDGTSAFLEGRQGSAVAVALLRDGVPVLGVVHAPRSPDRGADTIAWAEGRDHLLRNGAPVAPALAGRSLSAGDIVFLSQAAAEWPAGNARAVAPARFVALPSIAYRLARVAAGDGIAAVSLNGPCGWDYAAGHALIRGAGGVLLDQAGAEVAYTVDGASSTHYCFGGAAPAARALVARDWRKVRDGQRLAPRIALAWPRASGAALDRAVGCLMGQVAGDSLGSLVEFAPPDEIASRYPGGVRDLADGGTWDTIAGQPTDDSELALALARCLADRQDWSAEAIAAAYGDWYASRPFDIGGTTRRALSAAARAASAKAAAAQRAADPGSQSNGALMRCSPIGIWARDPAEAAAAGRADASLSHPHSVCQAASAAFTAAICCGIQGGDRQAMLAAAEAATAEPEAAALRAALARARQGEGPVDFVRQQGWVVLAFHNAFRHLAAGTALERAVIETVAQGGDTDTNAAICGALIGATQGRAAIPPRWSAPILACRTLAEADIAHPRHPGYWPDDVAELAEALLLRSLRAR